MAPPPKPASGPAPADLWQHILRHLILSSAAHLPADTKVKNRHITLSELPALWAKHAHRFKRASMMRHPVVFSSLTSFPPCPSQQELQASGFDISGGRVHLTMTQQDVEHAMECIRHAVRQGSVCSHITGHWLYNELYSWYDNNSFHCLGLSSMKHMPGVIDAFQSLGRVDSMVKAYTLSRPILILSELEQILCEQLQVDSYSELGFGELKYHTMLQREWWQGLDVPLKQVQPTATYEDVTSALFTITRQDKTLPETLALVNKLLRNKEDLRDWLNRFSLDTARTGGAPSHIADSELCARLRSLDRAYQESLGYTLCTLTGAPGSMLSKGVCIKGSIVRSLVDIAALRPKNMRLPTTEVHRRTGSERSPTSTSCQPKAKQVAGSESVPEQSVAQQSHAQVPKPCPHAGSNLVSQTRREVLPAHATAHQQPPAQQSDPAMQPATVRCQKALARLTAASAAHAAAGSQPGLMSSSATHTAETSTLPTDTDSSPRRVNNLPGAPCNSAEAASASSKAVSACAATSRELTTAPGLVPTLPNATYRWPGPARTQATLDKPSATLDKPAATLDTIAQEDQGGGSDSSASDNLCQEQRTRASKLAPKHAPLAFRPPCRPAKPATTKASTVQSLPDTLTSHPSGATRRAPDAIDRDGITTVAAREVPTRRSTSSLKPTVTTQDALPAPSTHDSRWRRTDQTELVNAHALAYDYCHVPPAWPSWGHTCGPHPAHMWGQPVDWGLSAAPVPVPVPIPVPPMQPYVALQHTPYPGSAWGAPMVMMTHPYPAYHFAHPSATAATGPYQMPEHPLARVPTTQPPSASSPSSLGRNPKQAGTAVSAPAQEPADTCWCDILPDDLGMAGFY